MKYKPEPYVKLSHPEWSKNATIYELNLRQYTPEGSFKAFESHLPRLKDIGVDILWLMPIHPIGVKNRKGTMGSYYAVRDYLNVNPEFGTMDDFKRLVSAIHDHGMYVILDWVANHTACDNHLVQVHPDWYKKSTRGDFIPTPWRDYSDIYELDYSSLELREYMSDALAFWVRETGIDGYRCDVADFVPVDFWEMVRSRLEAIRPIFMLAESETRDLHRKAFDMTYSWSLWEHLHGICSGTRPMWNLTEMYLTEHQCIWPSDGYRMNFIDNHDKNSWEGTQFSNFGDGLEAAIVLSVMIEGMPLLYSGQEAGLDKSLAFFEKDSIQWKPHRIGDLYKKLFALKHENRALWNGDSGGRMIEIHHDQIDTVLAFFRKKENDAIVAIVNLSADPISVNLDTGDCIGQYTELFTGESRELESGTILSMRPWQSIVYHRSGM